MSDGNTTPSGKPGQGPRKGKAKLTVVASDGASVAPETPEDRLSLLNKSQGTIRALRQWAHGRGLAMLGPCHYRGFEFSGMGSSGNPVYKPTLHRITQAGGTPDGLTLTDKETEFFTGLGHAASDINDFNIAENNLPRVKFDEDDFLSEDQLKLGVTGPWSIGGVGKVVRIGDGEEKHYFLFGLGPDGWFQVFGQPPYDMPLFGAGTLTEAGKTVVVHEGPKGWDRWSSEQRSGNLPPSLRRFLNACDHVAWHGSDIGIRWTDWHALRGRKVLVWPDIDQPGIKNARLIADRLSRLGNVVSYINWEDALLSNPVLKGWDLGSDNKPPANLSVSAVRKRLVSVESPFDVEGRVLPEWAARSFLDENAGEVYQVSNHYIAPVKKETFKERYGAKSWKAILNGSLNPYVASTFKPGIPPGKVEGGLTNTCPPSIRDHVPPYPHGQQKPTKVTRLLRRAYRRWFAVMIPDREERRYVLRRLALAIAGQQHVPNSMVVLLGVSGIGKGLLADIMVAVIGGDRAANVMPHTLLDKFNDIMWRKSFLFIHELHGSDLTKKDIAKKLKEIVGNSTYDMHKKYKDAQVVESTAHVFAASNESIPFTLERGNNRFYFVECGKPPSTGWDELMAEVYDPLTKNSQVHDTVAAMARYMVENMQPMDIKKLIQRPGRQDIWDRFEQGAALTAWQQEVERYLAEFTQEHVHEGDREPPKDVFVAEHLINLVRKEFRNVGPASIQAFLHEKGYRSLIKKEGRKVLVAIRATIPEENNARRGLWCRATDYDRLITQRGDELSRHAWWKGQSAEED